MDRQGLNKSRITYGDNFKMYRYFNGLLCFLCVGCSILEKKNDSVEQKSAEAMYESGCALLKKDSYESAAEVFKEIEALFPYSSKSCEGQILAAYSHFRMSNYMDAMRELDIFLKYHSSHKLVPYAIYLRAMCLYMQTSTPERDQLVAQQARQAFVEVINRFPNSPYYADSMKRVVILDDTIAGHEMKIGKYYQKRKNMLAAINRYNFIVRHLSHTPHIGEAYYRTIECCQQEGLENEAQLAYEVMKVGFSDSKWTAKASTLVSSNKQKR